MFAVQVVEYGHHPVVNEVPEPHVLGDDDVLVQVVGAGLCRTDVHAYEGLLRDVFPTPLPFTLGHEVAGTVVEVGPRVRAVTEGTPVILHPLMTCGMCDACRQGNDMFCADSTFVGLSADGGMAEIVRTSQRCVVPLSPATDPAQIAPLADAGLTAYHAIKAVLPRIDPTSVVVVVGAGGLGHLAVQMLKAMTPARVVAVDPSSPARALALEVGADAAVWEDRAEMVAELTRGAGAGVVLDFVGEGDAPSQALPLLARGGSYRVIGYGGEVCVPTMSLVLQEMEIRGNIVGTYRDLQELVALYENGLVRCESTVYGLTDALVGFDALEHGTVRGRAVVSPSEA